MPQDETPQPTPSPPSLPQRPATPPSLHYSRLRRRSPAVEILFLIFFWIPAVVFAIGLALWVLHLNEDDRQYVTVLAFLTGPLSVVILGMLLMLALTAVVRTITSKRQIRARVILGYLENAIRLNFPLDRFLQAAEESERPHKRLRLIMLRSALQQGMPVGAALHFAVPDVEERIATGLIAAENIGQLQPALTRLIERDTRDANTEPQTTPFYRFYFPLMLVGILGLTSFILVFIAPKFRDIFKDFHTSLPPLTQWLFDLGSVVDPDTVLVVALWTVLVVMVVLIARALQQFVRYMRHVQRSPFFFGLSLRWIPWYLPLWRQIIYDRTLSEVMEFLADARRAGMPLPQALDAAMALAAPPAMRWQFERWLDGMLGGETPARAAQNARFPALLVGFLQTGTHAAAGADTLAGPDVFDFLARYYRERFSRLTVAVRAAAEPLAAIVLGLLVGTVVLAVFLPLSALIESVMRGSERGFL